jgi:nifR3 family TIM-barrel protein
MTFLRKIKIGSKKIDTNIFLAPLAGCADLSFRLIAREHGAGLCFFEMVDANALLYTSSKNKDILMTHPKDRPIAAQILGGDPETVVNAARIMLDKIDPVFLDLNAACPARKLQKKNAGAYLTREPKNLYAVIERLAASLSLPITVKLRAGYKRVDIEKLTEVARNCEAAGAAALFIHGRACKQLYRGQVDYAAIAAVKQSVDIPVFGSGDIFSSELAGKMFEETGCDGILLARGAMGNPWIFDQIKKYLKSGKALAEVSFSQRKKVLLKHLAYMEKYRQSRPTNKIGLMRKIAILYMKHLPGASEIRSRITPAKNYREIVEVINAIDG